MEENNDQNCGELFVGIFYLINMKDCLRVNLVFHAFSSSIHVLSSTNILLCTINDARYVMYDIFVISQ